MTLPSNVSGLSGRLVGVLWGDAKSGKTTYACSLPGKKLLINFDPEGFSSVAYRSADVDVLDLSTMPATKSIQEAHKVADFLYHNSETYGSVIVDSLTTMTELALHDAIHRGIGRGKGGFIPTIEEPGLTCYGARNSCVNMVVNRILRATGINKQNCFFIAHADDPEIAQDNKTIIQQTIMLSSKIRNVVCLKVSEVYHLSIDNGKRTVYIAPFGVKRPMGSRVFDTETFKRFTLTYDINKDDDAQGCSLSSIIHAWKEYGFKKLTALPSAIHTAKGNTHVYNRTD